MRSIVARVAEVDQAGEELAAEHLADGGDGEEEVVVRGRDPLRAVGAEAAAGDDGVQVGVEEELAGPGPAQGVQNEGEANLSTEPLGVGGEGEQGVRGGAKEQPERARGGGRGRSGAGPRAE